MSVIDPFCHLHCHSHFSLLDGAAKPEALLEKANTLGMPALALTDHGNLCGAIKFYQSAKKIGVKPILGLEAYIAPGSRHNKKSEGGGLKESSYHLTLLAKNQEGFSNLLKLTTLSYQEGFYYKPRIDKEILEKFRGGLICLSGCASGELSRKILADKYDVAREVAIWYREIFGDDYYLEIQNNGLDIQHTAIRGCVELSKELDIPLVATSDVHYVEKKDAVAQDLLLCINTGRFVSDDDRMRMDTDEFHLRSPEEMYAAFPDLPDAVARSMEVADKIDLELDLGKRYFPVFTPPEGKKSEDYLREICIKALLERYEGNEKRLPGPDAPNGTPSGLSEEVIARLDRELDVISRQGYPNYFLVVGDLVDFARKQGIDATARGSGVGSLVCFALYISHVCPIEYDLLFERFLDVSRLEAPDIDVDFDQERRGEVLQYVKDTYGEANVAQIGTFQTLGARNAIKDVGRVLSYPLAKVNQISAYIPEKPGQKIAKALEENSEMQAAYESDGEVREVVDAAMSVEGLVRNVGTHACAVVIADKPIAEYVPLLAIAKKDDIVTQWEGPDVEEAGLLKMDFLGLRNLTILSKAVRIIEETTGEKIDPYKFPLDDDETFALLRRGETKGIFQLESGGIRDLLQRMKPTDFHDIIATSALYRPGPLEGGMVDEYVAVKNGQQEASYPHPIMEEVLKETHGVMVYQEQVMRVLNRLGGIELADSYKCIKAISKKKEKIIASYKEQFIKGCVENGLQAKKAEELFGMIEKFAGYGFNKSHSTAYALIAYMTAYLKAHYSVQFMAALLSSDISKRNFVRKDPLVEHLEDCARMGIVVHPADVNLSQAEFSVKDDQIYFALSAVKDCKSNADVIVQERQENGDFKDIFDLCTRLSGRSINKSAVESLIKAGALDSFTGSRSQLFAVAENAIQAGARAAAKEAADRDRGQGMFFDAFDEEPEEQAVDISSKLPDLPEWDEKTLLQNEKAVLGFYQSSHPLAQHEEALATYCSHTTAEASKLGHRTEVILGGMISSIKLSNTKNPKPGKPSRYAMFDLEDKDGIMRTILWPDNYEVCGEQVQSENIVLVRGKIDKRPGSEEANLIVDDLIPLSEADARCSRGVRIRVIENQHGKEALSELFKILRAYPGDGVIHLSLNLNDGTVVNGRSESMRVNMEKEMRQRVDELLGTGNFQILASK